MVVTQNSVVNNTAAPKTVVITGANSGIGLASAFHFARNGERVVMACRSLDKANKAKDQILAEVPNAQLVVLPLDVSSLDSVHEFARLFVEQVGQLDVLINNAGIVAIPLSRNAAGHELQLATNYLGAFALTGLLLPSFNPQRQGRIVSIGSLAHKFGKLPVEDLNWERTPYNEWKAYANSKVATLSFTIDLNRRLQAGGYNIMALGAHPGFANTNITQNSPSLSNKGGFHSWIQDKMQQKIPTAEQAAEAMIMAAESDAVRGGEYYGPTGFLEIGGKAGKAKINKIAFDTLKAKELWAVSESMTGVSYLSGL